VFGDVVAETPEAVAGNWEAIKKAEKGRESIFDGIPTGLPALLYATKVLKKAESLGVTPAADDGSLESALLALVTRARAEDVDPESALRSAANRLADEARAAEADTS
jgi:XTP/dITP diphosphohydrolase